MPTWVAVAAVAIGMGRNAMGRIGDEGLAGRRSIVERFGRDVLMGLPEGAVILSTGDIHYYPLLYLQVRILLNPAIRLEMIRLEMIRLETIRLEMIR